VNQHIFKKIEFDKTKLKDSCFQLDDTILKKTGKMIENVSYIHDHSIGKSILGHQVAVLTAITDLSTTGIPGFHSLKGFGN
jgi:hypothetical protein